MLVEHGRMPEMHQQIIHMFLKRSIKEARQLLQAMEELIMEFDTIDHAGADGQRHDYLAKIDEENENERSLREDTD